MVILVIIGLSVLWFLIEKLDEFERDYYNAKQWERHEKSMAAYREEKHEKWMAAYREDMKRDEARKAELARAPFASTMGHAVDYSKFKAQPTVDQPTVAQPTVARISLEEVLAHKVAKREWLPLD